MKGDWKALVLTGEDGKTYLVAYRVDDYRGAWKGHSSFRLEPHGFTVEAYAHPVLVEGEPPGSPLWFFQPGTQKSPIPADFGGEVPTLRARSEVHYSLVWGRREVKTSLASYANGEHVKALEPLVKLLGQKSPVFPGTFSGALKLAQKALRQTLSLWRTSVRYIHTSWGYGLIRGRYFYAATPYEILGVVLGTSEAPQGIVPLSSPKDWLIVTGAVERGWAAYGGPLKKSAWRHYVIASYDPEAKLQVLEAPQYLEERLSNRTPHPWPLQDPSVLGALKVVGKENPTLEIVMGPDEYRLIYTGDEGDSVLSMEWSFNVNGGPREEVRLYMGAEDIIRIAQAGAKRILVPEGGFYREEEWGKWTVKASPVWEGDGFVLMVAPHRPPENRG
ncbi:hypothetical protein MN1_620 [Thermus phage MN1]|nr:hypothetical protein MN1_620 [Thermus phage MN1]